VKHAFPASCLKIDSTYTNNKTFVLGLSIAYKFLTEPHPVGSFYNMSLPREIGDRKSSFKQVIPSSEVGNLSSSILKLGFVIEVAAIKEDAYCVTNCETGVITINKEFADMIVAATSSTHHPLSFLLGDKLGHEVAHLVMFRMGYGGKKTKTAGHIPKTPKMFMGEAGYEWESQTFGGIWGHYHRKSQPWKFTVLSYQLPFQSYYPLSDESSFAAQFSLAAFYTSCKPKDFFPEYDQDDSSSSNTKSALVAFKSESDVHTGDTELVPFVSAPCKRDF